MTILAVHLAITGRVQGVGYRASLQTVATALAVTGWVRNRLDGSVEAVLQGEKEALEHVIDWCHTGPPGARVESVTAEPVENSQTFGRFAGRPTA